MSYLSEQGYAQMKIQWSGEKIDKALARPDVSNEHKRKIQLILKAKNFFFDYLNEEQTKIYREVVFLKQEAVTYLVTASNYYEIKPKEFTFPFMGSFPYIGFFKQKSAIKYAKNLEADEYYTYVRPVYAYSSLGHFEDKILSSFFYLDDISLVETIYHELFHTLFFVKDEVDFNENVATFFAQKMLEKTDFLNGQKIVEYFTEQNIQNKLTQKIVQMVQDYSFRLKSNKPKGKQEADSLLKSFVDTELRPKILEECILLGLRTTRCTYAAKQWNNATFSAFLTYEKDQFYWSEWWKQQLGMTPRVFLQILKNQYHDFKNQSKIKDSFELFLKDKLVP